MIVVILASSRRKLVHLEEKSTMMAVYVSPSKDAVSIEKSISLLSCSSDIVILWFRMYGNMVFAMLFSEDV